MTKSKPRIVFEHGNLQVGMFRGEWFTQGNNLHPLCCAMAEVIDAAYKQAPMAKHIGIAEMLKELQRMPRTEDVETIQKLHAELNTLRAQLARKSQLANRLAFVVLHFWRSRDYWHQRFRWCARFSGQLQEREREREFED